MQQKKRSGLVELGGALILLGVGVKIALTVGLYLHPLASLAIFAGVVLLIIGLVAPGKQ